jgi:dTDP-glucose pyrophosphorylase
MDVARIGIIMVVDFDGRLIGTVTDGDVRRAVLANIDLNGSITLLLEQKQESVFAEPITAPSGADRATLRRVLQKHNINQLPLVDADQKVVALVTLDEFVPRQETSLQAVIMAGGAGTRLRPLTDNVPKPMLPVGDQPLLEIIVGQLRDAGIKQLNLAVHHQSEQITQHFGDGRNFGVDIGYVTEERTLGTAGAIGLLGSPQGTLLIIYGDIFTQVDFRAMVAYHQEQTADLTIAVQRYEMQVPYGVVECKGSSVQRLTEKPTLNFFVNAGIYLLEPQVQRLIPNGEPSDMTEIIEKTLNQGMNVAAFPIHEGWIDIGQPEQYQQAQVDAKNLKGSQ